MTEGICRQVIDGQDVGVLPVRLDRGRILLVDQRYLPDKLEFFDATNLEDMCFAIRDMVVRGAPSIGVAAALGLAAHSKKLSEGNKSGADFLKALREAGDKLQITRPTAVNLQWAIEKIYQFASDQLN